MTFGVLAVAGEITIPAYTTLWAILIGGQSCMLVISRIGAIDGNVVILGTMTTIFTCGTSRIALLPLRLLVLLCSYTTVCCMGLSGSLLSIRVW